MKCLECGWFKRDKGFTLVVRGNCLNVHCKKEIISDSDKYDKNRCTHYGSIEYVEQLMLVSKEEERVSIKHW